MHKHLKYNPFSAAKNTEAASVYIRPQLHSVHKCYSEQRANLLPGLEMFVLLKAYVSFFFSPGYFAEYLLIFSSSPFIYLTSYILWIQSLCAGWHIKLRLVPGFTKLFWRQISFSSAHEDVVMFTFLSVKCSWAALILARITVIVDHTVLLFWTNSKLWFLPSQSISED